ncbi:MAG: hypothetical protein AAGK97_10560 [Bacteroidota bacterium]
MVDKKKELQDLNSLEEQLDIFIYMRRQREEKERKSGFQKFGNSFLEHRLLIWLLCLTIVFTVAKLFISKISLDLGRKIEILNNLEIFAIFIVVVLIFYALVTLLFENLKFLKKSKSRRKVIEYLDILEANKIIEDLAKIDLASIARFELRLEKRIKSLKETVADSDLYISIFIVVIIIATRYIVGIDITQAGIKISSYTGGLSFFAAILIALRFFSKASKPKTLRDYEDFLIILKELKITRS